MYILLFVNERISVENTIWRSGSPISTIHAYHLILFLKSTRIFMSDTLSEKNPTQESPESKKEKGVSKATAQKLLAKYKQVQVRDINKNYI